MSLEPDGDFLPVQTPSDEHEIVATIDPPRDGHDHKLE